MDLIKRKIYRRNVGMVFADVLVPLTAGITIIMLSVFFGSPLVAIFGSLLGLGTIIGGTIAMVMLTDYILYNNVV